MRRHQGVNFDHFDVSNVIYHKFSLGAVPYTLNGAKRKRHYRLMHIIITVDSRYLEVEGIL